MLKNVFLFSLVLLSFTKSKSQSKINVGVLPFNYVNGAADYQDVNAIQESVTNAFVKTKRFNIVDRTKMEALKSEKELQKSEDFISGNVVAQGVSLGADYLITGIVSSATKTQKYVERTRLDGSKYNQIVYEATINFSCKVLDVSTGQVINSETFSTSGGTSLFGLIPTADNPQEAFGSSLSSLTKNIDKWVGKNFPATFSIVEIQDRDSKGNATKVLISGGSGTGLERKEGLKVVEVSEMMVDGKKLIRKKEIGELRVEKVEDENFSVCSVRDGEAEITKKFESKAKISVMTKN